MTTTAATARAGRREWIGLAVIALPCLVYAMDLTVLNLALPSLSADLRPTGAELLWIVDIYGFMVAGALITMGGLGDRIGRRRLLMIGGAGFAAASVLAAASTTPEMLIASRALLGIAGATLAPSTLSLISAMFSDPRQRTFAIGVWVTSYSAGAAIGPLAGGALLEAFWWGSVFLLALPVMALLLVVGPRVLPEVRDSERPRIDLPSAALSLFAVLAVIYGLKRAATDGADLTAGLPVAAGLIVGWAFAYRQRRLSDPLIDLALFRVPAFSAAISIQVIAFFGAFGLSVFVAQYLQSVLGLGPFEAGLWTAPEALGFIVGSMLAPRLRSPMHRLIGGGMAVGAAGLLVVAVWDGLAGVVTGITVSAVGLAVVVTLVTDLVVGSAPVARAGAASAISETGAELGGALGIALLGTLGAAIFQSAMGGRPETIAEAAVAGGAVLANGREAFADSLGVVALVGAGVVGGGGLLAALALRPRRERARFRRRGSGRRGSGEQRGRRRGGGPQAAAASRP